MTPDEEELRLDLAEAKSLRDELKEELDELEATFFDADDDLEDAKKALEDFLAAKKKGK